MLHSSRINPIIRDILLGRNTVRDKELGMSLDIATGGGIVRDMRLKAEGNILLCTVPAFSHGGQIPIKLWVQQMEYNFPLTGIPEKRDVLALNNNFDTSHYPEVQLYKNLLLSSITKGNDFPLEKPHS